MAYCRLCVGSKQYIFNFWRAAGSLPICILMVILDDKVSNVVVFFTTARHVVGFQALTPLVFSYARVSVHLLLSAPGLLTTSQARLTTLFTANYHLGTMKLGVLLFERRSFLTWLRLRPDCVLFLQFVWWCVVMFSLLCSIFLFCPILICFLVPRLRTCVSAIGRCCCLHTCGKRGESNKLKTLEHLTSA